MPAPTCHSVIIDSSTLKTIVKIEWIAPDARQSGGSPVTAYRIRRNNGYRTSVLDTYVEITDPSVLTYTFNEELLIGVTYKVIIAAVNAVHVSNAFVADNSTAARYSDELVIMVANVPAQVTGLHQQTTNYEKGKIKLAWTAPSTF